MTYNVVLYELDITGTNINNRIMNEPHSLSNKSHRSIAPINGPFFGSSLQIYDNVTNTILHRGTDYQIVELHQEATLRYGVEIANVILVINSEVNSEVRINYQTLGGHYLDNASAIANLYESVINDTRPVSWENVFNKPMEFRPSIHRHLLEDVYGFEPVVDSLERIRSAVTLGQTAVVVEIVNELLSKFQCGELKYNLPNKRLVTYDALLNTLTRLKVLSDKTIEVDRCVIMKGGSFYVMVTANVSDGTVIPWSLYKPSGNISLFSPLNGEVIIRNKVGYIYLYVQSADYVVDKPIYIGLKNDKNDIDFTAVTYELDIREHNRTEDDYSGIILVHDNYTSFDYGLYASDDVNRNIMKSFLA